MEYSHDDDDEIAQKSRKCGWEKRKRKIFMKSWVDEN